MRDVTGVESESASESASAFDDAFESEIESESEREHVASEMHVPACASDDGLRLSVCLNLSLLCLQPPPE